MNYKKLNEIKAGKAVYKHDGTLEQLQEVEMYCEGADSPTMKGSDSYYQTRNTDGLFGAIRTPHPGTTVYGSKDIFTKYHYFDEGAPVWVWDYYSEFGIKAYYEGTRDGYYFPYKVNNKYRGTDYYKNIAPRVEDTPECIAEVPKQPNDTPEQSDGKPEQSDDTPVQSDDTPVQSERKVKSVKTYTITLTEYEDGGIGLSRDCEGFNYFELIGVLKKVSELVERDFDRVKV